MTRDHYNEAVDMGMANLEAFKLAERHCQHMRIEFIHGNSPVGSTLGLPMGMLEVRCEFAPPPRWSGFSALDLAVDFYRENCVDCEFRKPSGEVPNLATVAAERAQQEAEQRTAAEREAVERARRHTEREERRRVAVAQEGYVIRDLAHWLDQIDAPSPRAQTAEVRRAGRQLIESARHAPDLFSPVLVETLLGLAGDTGEPAAFLTIRELVRAQRCHPRSAAEAALKALKVSPEPEAARLLDLLRWELHPEDLTEVLDGLIEMASNQQEPWGSEPVLEGLRVATAVDLPGTTNRIAMLLQSVDDATRGAAADAAWVLLDEDPQRVIALASPLIASIQGEDEGYAGRPHPAASAVKALARAWRDEPDLTMSLVETHAVALPEEARAVLVRVVWFLEGWRRPWDASDAAGRAAIEFCLRRLGGDWGERAADEASHVLERLTPAVPQLLAERVDWLVGIVLEMTSPRQVDPFHVEQGPTEEQAMLDALNRTTNAITRSARLRRTAETLGTVARVAPASALPKLQTLFESELGYQDQVTEVRLVVLDALEKAVCPDLLRELLPLVYTALLHRDQSVRAAGIDVWAACARAAKGALPEELADLAAGLLSDSYVIVHARMLQRLPTLSLPARLAPELIELVAGWAHTHLNNPEILDDALWALRHLAGKLESESLSVAWLAVALRFAAELRPYDRQRYLLVDWPPVLADSTDWARPAVSALSSRELADYYNVRHDPLLAKLMERPTLLRSLSSIELMAMSDVHAARMVWRALEPVELLQAAGRWKDASAMAERVAERQPRGMEGKYGRDLAGLVAAAARHSLVSSQWENSDTNVERSHKAVRDAIARLTATSASSDGEDVSRLIDASTAMILAGEALAAPIAADPDDTASRLTKAAGLLRNPATARYASGAQRHLVADAWDVASMLLRHDAAVRSASADAAGLLASAKRGAQVLRVRVQAASEMPPFTEPLLEFLKLVEAVSSPTDISKACLRLLTVTAPLPLVGQLEREPIYRQADIDERESPEDEDSLAVCIADFGGAPVTDVMVVKPNELYTVGMTAWIPSWPTWAETCVIEPVSRLPSESLALPRFAIDRADANVADGGFLLHASEPLVCRVEQPINGPPVDCPLVVRFLGESREQTVEVAGYRRLRLRPFDPARDALTEHQQTDQRLLQMFDRLAALEFDTEDVRAFCRLFSCCVRAAQGIMFDRTFRRGASVKESQFHDELERRLRADPTLEGRLTRRDEVAGGFDDLLHDDVIAELKVNRECPVMIEDCARFLGQPTQYAVGRGSQLSVLVVLDHSSKEAPPGVIENYVGWLQPSLHGLTDPTYPSLVGVLVVNTNLPVPSSWSRKRSAPRP